MKLINLKNNELIIDKDTKDPIIIIHNLNEKDEKKLKIEVKKNIKASVIEVFLSNKETKTNIDQENKHDFEREFKINENANLEYLKYQDVDKLTDLNINSDIVLEETSNINITNLELGRGINNNTFNTSLNKSNSSITIFGLVKLFEKTNFTSIFNTIHNAKNSSSNISYKHSLHDNSKAIYEAKTIVNEEGLYSKVIQNSNTILLSDDAAIFARPHLEINIDELEASHGVTTGSLDKEQLLYLQARGIPKNKAYEMLLKAFENEVYDNINDIKIKEFIENFKKGDYV